jgi:hypothetical protein
MEIRTPVHVFHHAHSEHHQQLGLQLKTAIELFDVLGRDHLRVWWSKASAESKSNDYVAKLLGLREAIGDAAWQRMMED